MKMSCKAAGLVVALVLVSSAARAEGGSKAAVQKKLESEYALTKTTDDKSDIVTAGAVLVLQKDKLLMVSAASGMNPCPNMYRDGKLTQSTGCRANERLKRFGAFASIVPGQDKAPATRYFVSGEKFWVTKIDVRDVGKEPEVVFDLFSDAINEVRYRSTLAIPFRNGIPDPDSALKLVAEVVTVEPAQDTKDSKGSAQPAEQSAASSVQPAAPAAAATPAPAAPAPQETPLAAIPPPPPPDDAPPPAPPTVAEGQTTDQVIAILGQPAKKAKIGAKEIYYYKDLKVTFMNGKVKDVQ